MAMIGKVRRMFFRQKKTVREIVRLTSLSRNTVRKWLKTPVLDEAENDVLAFMTFPRAHWPQIYSTKPLERLHAEIKRRTRVVGIFPNDASITRLVGAMMLEQNDEWSLNRRYMHLEGLQSLSDTVPTRLSAVAR